jgi:hypothetical protein
MIKEYGYYEKVKVAAVEGTTVTLLGRICHNPEDGLISISPKAVFGASISHIQKFLLEQEEHYLFPLPKLTTFILFSTLGLSLLLFMRNSIPPPPSPHPTNDTTPQ